MKILVTGTNGFIGRNIKEFLEVKHYNVYSPKRNELDLLNEELVSSYLTKEKFDVVIHCGITLTSIDQNIKMFFNIEKLSKHFGKLICVGSGAEFGLKYYKPKMKESYFDKHVPDKSDIYGYSKYIIAKKINEKRENIYNLRVFGIFGKYEDYRRRFISNNICRVLMGEDISINKNTYFDYLYVNDFLKILEKFILNNSKQNIYNVCSGKIVDFLTLANIIKNIDGTNKKITIRESGINPEYSGDNSLLLQEFEDIEFSAHEKSIEELYFWYKNESKLKFDKNIFNSWIKN